MSVAATAAPTPTNSNDDTPVQPLSVHRLNLPKVEGAFQSKEDVDVILPTVTSLETLIARIVQAYNEKTSNLRKALLEPGFEAERKKKRYFKRIVVKDPERYEQNEFKMLAYEQSTEYVPKISSVLKSGTVQKIGKIANLIFFFRDTPREIFAITSSHSFRVVYPYADFKFPFEVAKRILDPKRITKITRKCLFGHATIETLVNPDKARLFSLSSLYHLVDTFKCYLRTKSSMHMLLRKYDVDIRQKPIAHSGEDSDNPDGEEVVEEPVATDPSDNGRAYTMIVNKGQVKIVKPLPITTFPDLLQLYSNYICGENTFNEDGALEIEDPDRLFEFLSYLQIIDVLETDALDKQLVERIRKAFQEMPFGNRSGVVFRHKFLDDYLSAGSFEIDYGRKCAIFNHPPILEEIIKLFTELKPTILDDEEQFFKMLADSSLRFKSQGLYPLPPAKLIKCLEGQILFNEVTYFKMSGHWYELRSDYQCLVEYNFREMLKTTLLTDKDVEWEWLRRPWAGSEKKGYLTEKAVAEVLGLQGGVRTVLQMLQEQTVAYIKINAIFKVPTVFQRRLVGEILDDAVVKQHQTEIEAKVLSAKSVPSEAEMKALFKDDANHIRTELFKKRKIIVVEKEKKFVKNPFLGSLKTIEIEIGKKQKKKIRPFEKAAAAFEAFLMKQYEFSSSAGAVMDEETYNRSFLYDPPAALTEKEGYLVFDQITPFGIEPCDVIRFSKDTTFLYHIKEKFGQHTRDACSQILNAAKQMRSALSLTQSITYLDKLWDDSTSDKAEQTASNDSEESKKYRKDVREQLKKLGKESFLNIFRNRKVVFVYACSYAKLDKEVALPSRLEEEDFANFGTSAAEIFKELKEEEFLDGQGRLTGKFYATSQVKFNLKKFAAQSGEIFKTLSAFRSKSKSTIAKLDLMQVSQEVRSLGFEFRICEIPKSTNGAEADSSQSDEGSATQTQGSQGTKRGRDSIGSQGSGSGQPAKKRKTAGSGSSVATSSDGSEEDATDSSGTQGTSGSAPSASQPSSNSGSGKKTNSSSKKAHPKLRTAIDKLRQLKAAKVGRTLTFSQPVVSGFDFDAEFRKVKDPSLSSLKQVVGAQFAAFQLTHNVGSEAFQKLLFGLQDLTMRDRIRRAYWDNLSGIVTAEAKANASTRIESWKKQLGSPPKFEGDGLYKSLQNHLANDPMLQKSFLEFQKFIEAALRNRFIIVNKERVAKKEVTDQMAMRLFARYKLVRDCVRYEGDKATHEKILAHRPSIALLCDSQGIPNLGNTCWLNTILQSIAALDEIILDPDRQLPQLAGEKSQDYFARVMIRRALQQYMGARAWGSEQIVKALAMLLEVLKLPGIPADIRNNRFEQQDARPILTMALHALNLSFKERMKRIAGAEQSIDTEPNPKTAMIIPLGEPAEGSVSLDLGALVADHYKEKQMDARWKTHSSYTVKTWIEAAPSILMIDIERLYVEDASSDEEELFTQLSSAPEVTRMPSVSPADLRIAAKRSIDRPHKKNTTPIEYPKDGVVSLKVFDEGHAVPVEYEILSFTSHSGGASGGHWIACRRGVDGKWRRYSDNSTPLVLDQSALAHEFAGSNQIILRKRDVRG